MKLTKLSEPTHGAPTQADGAVPHIFWLFDLSDLVARQLLINISLSIVSLLSGESDSIRPVIAQQILTQNEMRMLLPLLEAPTCCQHAVLQVSFSCNYELLLQSVFASSERTRAEWDRLVIAEQQRLASAQEQNSQRDKMRGVYNAIFALRKKLHPFGLTIRSKRAGYYLAKDEQ